MAGSRKDKRGREKMEDMHILLRILWEEENISMPMTWLHYVEKNKI